MLCVCGFTLTWLPSNLKTNHSGIQQIHFIAFVQACTNFFPCKCKYTIEDMQSTCSAQRTYTKRSLCGLVTSPNSSVYAPLNSVGVISRVERQISSWSFAQTHTCVGRRQLIDRIWGTCVYMNDKEGIWLFHNTYPQSKAKGLWTAAPDSVSYLCFFPLPPPVLIS